MKDTISRQEAIEALKARYPTNISNWERVIEQIRSGEVERSGDRNRMGCSESWYDPAYAITHTFSREEIDNMTDRDLEMFIRLAMEIGEGLY